MIEDIDTQNSVQLIEDVFDLYDEPYFFINKNLDSIQIQKRVDAFCKVSLLTTNLEESMLGVLNKNYNLGNDWDVNPYNAHNIDTHLNIYPIVYDLNKNNEIIKRITFLTGYKLFRFSKFGGFLVMKFHKVNQI